MRLGDQLQQSGQQRELAAVPVQIPPVPLVLIEGPELLRSVHRCSINSI